MSLWYFLTCRPDLVVIGKRFAFPVGLSVDSIGSDAGFSIVDVVESQHTGYLKKGRAAVVSLDDH